MLPIAGDPSFLALWRYEMKKAIVILAVISLVGILVYSTADAEISNENYQSLLDELQQKVDEADKRMVAHPKFLDELRALVEKYRARIRNIFFSDDFSDGNFTENPVWQVKSGQFRIGRDKRLWSKVSTYAPVTTTTEKPLSKEQQAIGILLRGIMGSGQNDQPQNESTSPEPGEAFIKIGANIEPAFEIDISFVSESEWGSMEVVLLGGAPEKPRYRLIYQAAASESRPIEIIRERSGRAYTIESALRYPNLDDNKLHRLQWIRDLNGTMKVLVDGKEILQTVEVYYRDVFSGLALINKGGTYAWDSVKAMSPLPVEK